MIEEVPVEEQVKQCWQQAGDPVDSRFRVLSARARQKLLYSILQHVPPDQFACAQQYADALERILFQQVFVRDERRYRQRVRTISFNLLLNGKRLLLLSPAEVAVADEEELGVGTVAAGARTARRAWQVEQEAIKARLQALLIPENSIEPCRNSRCKSRRCR